MNLMRFLKYLKQKCKIKGKMISELCLLMHKQIKNIKKKKRDKEGKYKKTELN